MTRTLALLTAIACTFTIASATASVAPDSTSRKLEGGKGGNALESITVEGEDRVRVEFERPALKLDVDPESAPGLDWGSVRTVLDAGHIRLVHPLIARSAFFSSPYRARPWLNTFREGAVARFTPKLEGVERWTLSVADSRGRDVVAFSGKGKPPKRIDWNGIDANGSPVPPGVTYSFSVSASDEAGNTRNFVGDGFEIPPYTVSGDGAMSMLFSVETLSEGATLLEAASRINQIDDLSKPVVVEVTASSFKRASAIADNVVAQLRPELLGDPARVTSTTRILDGASESGSVAIRVGGVK